MSITSSTILVLSLLGQGAEVPNNKFDPQDRVIQSIVESGNRVIGVCPKAIGREPNKPSTLSESIGPLTDRWAEEFSDKLQRAAQEGPFKGKFKVKPFRDMESAFHGKTIEDLGDPDFKKKLGKDLKLDGLVVLKITNNGDQWDQSVEVIDIPSQTLLYTNSVVSNKTLGDAAYAGESWWIRSWQKRPDGSIELSTPGLELEMPQSVGDGPTYEMMQYKNLKPGLQHPMLMADCPYAVNLRVGNEWRKPELIDGKLYVRLEPDEQYVVALSNKSEQPVFIALYIDGVNSINRQLKRPSETATFETWSLKPNFTGGVAGWYAIEQAKDTQGVMHPSAKQLRTNFKVTGEKESVAGGKNFNDNLGMITAIVYTHGMDGIQKAPPMDVAQSPGLLGTGIGDRHEDLLEFDFSGKEKGIILAAMTLHYRTESQLSELRNSTARPKPIAEGSPSPIPIGATPEWESVYSFKRVDAKQVSDNR